MICVSLQKKVGLAVLLIWPIVGNCELTVSTFMFYVNIIIVGSFSTVFENVGFVKFS